MAKASQLTPATGKALLLRDPSLAGAAAATTTSNTTGSSDSTDTTLPVPKVVGGRNDSMGMSVVLAMTFGSPVSRKTTKKPMTNTDIQEEKQEFMSDDV